MNIEKPSDRFVDLYRVNTKIQKNLKFTYKIFFYGVPKTGYGNTLLFMMYIIYI